MIKRFLTDAKNKLKEEAYEPALEASTRALELDGMNFQALMLKGKCHFHLNQGKEAEIAYRRAVDLQPETPLPWKGLLEVFEQLGEYGKSIEPLEKLIGILKMNEKWDRCQKVTSDLAKAATLAGQAQKALDAWFPLVIRSDKVPDLYLETNPNEETPTLLEIWIAVLDIAQTHRLLGQFKTIDLILDNIVRLISTLQWTEATPLHSKVVAALDIAVENRWLHLVKAPCNEKQSARAALDDLAQHIVLQCPTAKRAAEIRLLRHEDADGVLSDEDIETCLEILKNSAPNSAWFLLHRGLKSHVAARDEEAVTFLLQGIASAPENIAGRVALAHLSLRPSTFDATRCLDMIHSSQDAVQLRFNNLGTSPHLYSDTEMNLLQARALIAQNKWSDAIMVYENVVEHEPFLPEAIVGLSEAHLHQMNIEAAASTLQFLPPQTSAAYCAAQGWLLYHQGSLDEARLTLESGLQYDDVTWTLKYRLGQVYWSLDGEYRQNKNYCVALLLGAAKLNSANAEIFNLLGTWYRTIAADNVRAEKCFLKALSLDPSCENAGLSLTDMYSGLNEYARLVRLWTENSNQQVHAPWAIHRLAQHQVTVGDEGAIGNMHKLLRHDPTNPTYWAALGHVYQVFGRIVASQKSYMKSLELKPDSTGVLCELARIELSLGLLDEALAHLFAVVDPNTAVLKLLAETLYTKAKAYCAQGLYGRSYGLLKEASAVLKNCLQKHPSHPSLYKLLGDIHQFAFFLTPDGEWLDFLQEGTNAYLKALEMQSQDAAGLFDVGLGYWYQAQASGFMEGLPMSKWSLQHEPKYPERLNSLVNSALSYFTKSLEINPHDAKVWNAFGTAHQHIALKQFAFIRAIELENLDSAWANLGMVYLDAGLTSMAQRAFLSLQGVNPNHPAMWLGYGLMECKNNDLEQAHAAYTCAMELRLDLDILNGFAYTGLRSPSGSNDQVLFALKKYAERDNKNPAAINNLGVAYLRTGLYRQAIDSFKRALTLVDSTCELKNGTQLNLIQALLYDKQYDEAEKQLNGASNPLLTAQIYLQRGTYNEALPLLRDQTSNLNAQLAYAVVLYKLDQGEKARSLLQELLIQQPNESDSILTLTIQLGGTAWWTPSESTMTQALCDPLVKLYQKNNMGAECKRICEYWTRTFPTDPNGWLAIAESTLHFGRVNVQSHLSALPFVLPYEAHLRRAKILSMTQLVDSWHVSDAECKKWLHLNPMDPVAPLVVAMSLLKQHWKDPSGIHLNQARKWLNGYVVDETDPYRTWLWHILSCYTSPSQDKIMEHANLASIYADKIDAHPTTILLLRARSEIYRNQKKSIDFYLEYLNTELSPSRNVYVELAILLEINGYQKSAWRIWKDIDLDIEWKSIVQIKRSYFQRENIKIPIKCLKEIILYNMSDIFLTNFKIEFDIK